MAHSLSLLWTSFCKSFLTQSSIDINAWIPRKKLSWDAIYFTVAKLCRRISIWVLALNSLCYCFINFEVVQVVSEFLVKIECYWSWNHVWNLLNCLDWRSKRILNNVWSANVSIPNQTVEESNKCMKIVHRYITQYVQFSVEDFQFPPLTLPRCMPALLLALFSTFCKIHGNLSEIRNNSISSSYVFKPVN